MEEGTMTFTADLKAGLLVVRDVPATVCDQCGAQWLDNDASVKIDEYAKEMQTKGAQVEIVSYSLAVEAALDG
jgi:YgiT-type zinc finger domain-containing protein